VLGYIVEKSYQSLITWKITKKCLTKVKWKYWLFHLKCIIFCYPLHENSRIALFQLLYSSVSMINLPWTITPSSLLASYFFSLFACLLMCEAPLSKVRSVRSVWFLKCCSWASCLTAAPTRCSSRACKFPVASPNQSPYFVTMCVCVCARLCVHVGVRVHDNKKYSPFEEKQ